MKARLFIITFLLALGLSRGAASEPATTDFIQQLYLVHFSHTDYGFTDHPSVCRDMQRRYLDIALDTAMASARAFRSAIQVDCGNHRCRQ